jgi:acetoin utilization deacetylase AcuC-like enzyme
MTTGVFFHEIFSRRDWIIIGNKFRNFPEAMEHTLKLPRVKLFVPRKVSEELLLEIHSPRLVRDLKEAWYYEGASYAVGGCVEATEKIASGEIDNALVFSVAAGHHAEHSSAWGGTYVSCAGPAIFNARQKFGELRFAILDTDAHHGNGTREIFLNDDKVLHVCFCGWNLREGKGVKLCVDVGYKTTDDEYIDKVRQEFITRAREFKPDMIWHNLGHDTCQGDYGDRGLTPEFYPRLVKEVKECADEVCRGRYVIVTHGGKRADVAEYIFPRIIEILAEPYSVSDSTVESISGSA